MSAATLTLPDRDTWLDQRHNSFGASESASLFGVGYESAYAVLARKINRLAQDPPTEEMEIGLLFQPKICELFEKRTGLRVLQEPDYTIRRHPEIPWLTATLDGLVHDPANGGFGVAEIKNVGYQNAAEWKDDQEPPLKFNVQVQHQLAVTGFQFGWLVGLIGGNKLAWKLIERNDRFIEVMIDKLAEFWDCVECGEMPPVDGSESTARALALLYPHDSGETVPLPAEAVEKDARLVEVRAQLKGLEAEERELTNWFKAQIADATFGVCDGVRYSLKTTTRAGYSVDETTFRVLRKMKG